MWTDGNRRVLGTVSLMFAAAVMVVAGCGSDRLGDDPDENWRLEDDTGTNTDTGPRPDTDAPDGCSGENPGCYSCTSDVVPPATCVDGEWTCSSGEPGPINCTEEERCGEKPTCAKSCAGDDRAEPTCGMSLWHCPQGTFRTDRYCENECEVDVSNVSLEGVEIRFPGTCRWAIGKVREGIDIPYEVVVEEEISGIVPTPTDAGSCDRPGDSGLITSVVFQGDDQRWCRCDTGNCPRPQYKPKTLEPGTYRNTVHWEGRNWTGPSDTGNPKGEPFPPGTYEMSVQTRGERAFPDGRRKKFKVEATMEIELIE